MAARKSFGLKGFTIRQNSLINILLLICKFSGERYLNLVKADIQEFPHFYAAVNRGGYGKGGSTY